MRGRRQWGSYGIIEGIVSLCWKETEIPLKTLFIISHTSARARSSIIFQWVPYIFVVRVLHRALFTWFNLLIFLILLVLRLDQRIEWNWFIIFIPMWLYDNILLIYIVFNMITFCKNGQTFSLQRETRYMIAVILKLCVQILICLKLEAPHWSLPAKVVLAPFWLLFPVLAVDVIFHLRLQTTY